MLKIKRNINFREIEKLGFVYCDYSLFPNILYINQCNTPQNRIFIYKDLHLRFGNINKNVLDTLYDLIKADLVEKVE